MTSPNADTHAEPLDAHDRAWRALVMPPDHENPTPPARYNLAVIGAGTAGLVSSAIAASLGAKVALIERRHMGGDCLNVGCVPSKALIRAARAAADIQRAPQFGIDTAGASIDFAAVMERVRRVRAEIAPHDSVRRFRDEYGVDVYLGDATFTGPDVLDVGGIAIRFSRAVIATGSRPAIPAIEGLDTVPYLTNETIFARTHLPERLTVLGGGPIGCELAQAFARLGSRVTILQSGSRLLPREDPDVSQMLERRFIKEGIRVVTDCTLYRVEAHAHTTCHFTSGFEDGTLDTDTLLIATGRRPNVEGLGLDAAGVDFNKHGVLVNDRLQTANRRIFAAGDVVLPYRFTHAADAAARLVVQNALFWGRTKFSSLTIPWCTYTDPEIAHVGHNQTSATEAGIPIDVYERPLSEVDRARTEGDTEGCVRICCVKGKDSILGATIVAPHAGDMINEITLAMNKGHGLASLADVIHPYPTEAEAIRQCGDAFRRTRLTPARKRLLQRYFAWRR